MKKTRFTVSKLPYNPVPTSSAAIDHLRLKTIPIPAPVSSCHIAVPERLRDDIDERDIFSDDQLSPLSPTNSDVFSCPQSPLSETAPAVAQNVRFVDNHENNVTDDDENVSLSPTEMECSRFLHVPGSSIAMASEHNLDGEEMVDATATVRPPSSRRASIVVNHISSVGRQFAKRVKRRLVLKDGSCNISTKNVIQRKRRYMVDIFTTFVDMKWRYNIALFGIAFIGSWFAFALIWWGQAMINGDYRAINDTNWPVCVTNVYDFPTALLFSVETQHTIGYGTRAMETNCPFAVIILMLQSCYGVFVQSLMTGLIFSKLSRPKHRALTMMFSKFAVICLRDNQYCLLFRVGDMRRSHIIGTSIRALIVKNRTTKEGEKIPMCQYSLDVETETNFGDNFVFLVWPVTVVHKIVSGSPLWDVSRDKLFTEEFEIIVILEGVVENTGMTTQFRTSYLPSEIKWGHQLKPLLTNCKNDGQYDIDFSQFNATLDMNSMPHVSARVYAELRAQQSSMSAESRDEPCGNFTSELVIRRGQRHATSSLKRLMFNKGRKKTKKSSQSLNAAADGTVDSLQKCKETLRSRRSNTKLPSRTNNIPRIIVTDANENETTGQDVQMSNGKVDMSDTAGSSSSSYFVNQNGFV